MLPTGLSHYYRSVFEPSSTNWMYGWTKLGELGTHALPSSALTGISTRGPISSENKLTPSILIEGTKSKKVVFMAKGYSMFVTNGVIIYADDLEMEVLSYNDTTQKWDDQGTYGDFGDVTSSTTTSGATVENISTLDILKTPRLHYLKKPKKLGWFLHYFLVIMLLFLSPKAQR